MRKSHHICAEDRESTGVPCARPRKATKATTDAFKTEPKQETKNTRMHAYASTTITSNLGATHSYHPSSAHQKYEKITKSDCFENRGRN